MRDWLEGQEIPYIVTATKADKLSGNKRKDAERAVQDWPGACGAAPGLLVSSQSGAGIAEVWRHMTAALERG